MKRDCPKLPLKYQKDGAPVAEETFHQIEGSTKGLGDGKMYFVIAKGDINLTLKSFILSNGVVHNFLSVSKLVQVGYVIFFDQEGASFRLGDKIVARGEKMGSLYNTWPSKCEEDEDFTTNIPL
ncbi:hypothetical protein R1sor_020900 [Riccia sorocarpa]|uniref:Uncharacterized protein n=1 Tax=Riccia sorocarpa TaxID=122646 RepID=A0ABD3GL80_9MARC